MITGSVACPANSPPPLALPRQSGLYTSNVSIFCPTVNIIPRPVTHTDVNVSLVFKNNSLQHFILTTGLDFTHTVHLTAVKGM